MIQNKPEQKAEIKITKENAVLVKLLIAKWNHMDLNLIDFKIYYNINIDTFKRRQNFDR